MDGHRDEEVAASPLLAAPTQAAGGRRRSHAADVHILCAAFLFVFSAYCAAQNLESTVNTEGDLGTVSLGVLYTSFTLFSVVASPVVTRLGPKHALVVGTSGYVLFILANLVPSWYTMVPASLYLGFCASIIWVGQGTYLTSAALSHARDNNLPEGPTLGKFTGEFWGIFASTQVLGNLLSLALLRNGKDGGSVMGENMLFVVFLGCMIVGIVLMCFLSKREEKGNNDPVHSSFGAMLKYIVSPLKDQRILLIIPLMVYIGLQHAFVWAVFTKSIVKPVLGISGVGGAMAIYGAADAICALVTGRLTSGLYSATLIVSIGTVVQALVLFWLLLFYRFDFFKMFFLNRGAFSPRSRAMLVEIPRSPGFEPWMAGMGLWPRTLATTACRSAASLKCYGAAVLVTAILVHSSLSCCSPIGGVFGTAAPLLIGALWGVGDGMLNTVLNTVLGLLFEETKEAAFAQCKVWECAAVAVIFFLSPNITLQAMLILMTTALFISCGSFLFLTIVIEKPSTVRS